MSFTIEVKTLGKRRGEAIWLDLSQCKVLKNGPQSLFLTDGVTCFSIYKGRRRKRWLENRGYDPDAVWQPEEVQQ